MAGELGSWRARLTQAGALVGLSTVLGFAFNTANPLGVRWSEPSPAPAPERALNRAAPPPAVPVPLPAGSPPAFVPSPPPPSPSPPSRSQSLPPVTAAAVATTPGVAPAVLPSPAAPAFRSPAPLHWNQVQPLVEAGTVLLVDSRAKPAYDAGHIPAAVHLAESSSPDEIQAFRARYGTNTHVVVYCSSTSCSLSFRLAYKLVRDYGFAQADYMTGGYLEYQRETGLAATANAVASPPSLRPPTAPGEPAPLPISWTKAVDWLNRDEAVLVDARPPADYAAGHLPRAVSLPLNASTQQLAAFRQRVGTNQAVVVYGERAGSLTALDLAARLLRELALPSARFLPEGYQELAALTPPAAGTPAP